MFHQGSMSNPQWYKSFNMKVDISECIGVTRQHKALLEYVMQQAHSLNFYACTEQQQAPIHIDSEECYLYYALLRQSGTHTNKMKVELHNDLTTIKKLYPKSYPQTLHLLDKYSKIFLLKTSTSEGSSFAQVDSRPDPKKEIKKVKETVEEAEIINRQR